MVCLCLGWRWNHNGCAPCGGVFKGSETIRWGWGPSSESYTQLPDCKLLGTCLKILLVYGDAMPFFNGRWIVLRFISFDLLSQAINKIKELALSIEGKSLEEKKGLLAKCAATTLSSKLIGGEKEFFASMVVDAVIAIGSDDRLNLIGIKKVCLIVIDVCLVNHFILVF